MLIYANENKKLEKNGASPDKVVELYENIRKQCRKVDLRGLMTIGSFETSTNVDEPNRDFQV